MLRTRRDRMSASGIAFAVAALTVAPAHAAEGGLQLIPDPVTLASLLGLYVLLILVLNPLLFKPIFRVMDERNEQIAGTRRRAETLARETREIIDRYDDQVRADREESERARRGTLDDTRRQVAERIGDARATAESEIERARSDVEAALTDARTGLRDQARGLAAQAAEQVLGRAL